MTSIKLLRGYRTYGQRLFLSEWPVLTSCHCSETKLILAATISTHSNFLNGFHYVGMKLSTSERIIFSLLHCVHCNIVIFTCSGVLLHRFTSEELPNCEKSKVS